MGESNTMKGFLFAVMTCCVLGASALPSTEEIVSEAPMTEMAQSNEEFSPFHWLGAGIYDKIAKGRGECVTTFPCYMRSKVEWQKDYLKNYMLAGPMRKAIMAIPGLHAYVCPHGHKGVTKWLKFDTKASLTAFKNLQATAFNPHTRLHNFRPKAKCLMSAGQHWKGHIASDIDCWMSAWEYAGAEFTVTDNPHVADVQSNSWSYHKRKNNPTCVRCTKDTKCFRPSWHLKRL